MEENFQCNNFRLLSFVHYCNRVSVQTENESGFSRNKPQKRLHLLAVLPLTANYTPTTARHAAALIQMPQQPHRWRSDSAREVQTVGAGVLCGCNVVPKTA